MKSLGQLADGILRDIIFEKEFEIENTIKNAIKDGLPRVCIENFYKNINPVVESITESLDKAQYTFSRCEFTGEHHDDLYISTSLSDFTYRLAYNEINKENQ